MKMFISLVCLLIWNSSAHSQGEIAQSQQHAINRIRAQIKATAAEISQKAQTPGAIPLRIKTTSKVRANTINHTCHWCQMWENACLADGYCASYMPYHDRSYWGECTCFTEVVPKYEVSEYECVDWECTEGVCTTYYDVCSGGFRGYISRLCEIINEHSDWASLYWDYTDAKVCPPPILHLLKNCRVAREMHVKWDEYVERQIDECWVSRLVNFGEIEGGKYLILRCDIDRPEFDLIYEGVRETFRVFDWVKEISRRVALRYSLDNKGIRCIDFSGCKMKHELGIAIGILGGRMNDLRMVMMNDCDLDDDMALSILAQLSGKKYLHTIYIGGNPRLSSHVVCQYQDLLRCNCAWIRDDEIDDKCCSGVRYTRDRLVGLESNSKDYKTKMTEVVDEILSTAVFDEKLADDVRSNEKWETYITQVLKNNNMQIDAWFYRHLAAGIRRVGQDKTKYICNVSGCESEECIDALIDVLKHRNDIVIVNIANCNLTLEIAKRLLEVIEHNMQLQVINIVGNDFPDDVIQAFQAIVERNHAHLLHALYTVDINSASLSALVAEVPNLDGHTISLIAQHPNSDHRLLSYIITERSHGDNIILGAVANNPSATLDVLWEIVRQPNVSATILTTVAGHSNVNAELREEITMRLAQLGFGNTLDSLGWQGSHTNRTMTEGEADIGETWGGLSNSRFFGGCSNM